MSEDTRREEAIEAVRTDPDRIAAVRATGLLDTEVEEVFDRLTRMAVRLLRIPAAFISLVDADRDFYKSASGFGEPLASARELQGRTFCHYTAERSDPLVIPDTAGDVVFRDVPTVRTLGVAAYVGVPLVLGRQTVGAFCAIDTEPHAWTPEEVDVLVELAASAQREMELRGAVAALSVQGQELERAHAELRQRHEDLTHRATAVEAANRAKEQFLSMMSHELRAPLGAMIGYADLLAMGIRGPVSPPQMEFLERIERAGRHLQVLLADILEFARIEAGKIQYHLEDVSVDDAIAHAAELVVPHIAERGITFVHVPSDAHVRVHADPDRLRQVLVNLMTNAMKFTPIAGRVDVGWERSEGEVRVRVADTGRGIPPDQLERVFEAFVQVDRTQTEAEHQGVGLGLAICRQLARGMGAELTVESEVGRGSTFTLTLPLAASPTHLEPETYGTVTSSPESPPVRST